MPEEIVEGLVAQGVPPQDAMAMAYPEGGGMAPPMGAPAPPMAPAGGEDEMLAMLLEQVMMKWMGEEVQMAGEKGALLDTLMMIAQSAGALPPEAMFAEGAPMAGPMMPVEEVPY